MYGNFLPSATRAVVLPKIKYDITYHKIIYKTTYKGNPIKASGIVAIPKNLTEKATLISVHHGTITKYSEAPSASPSAVFTGFSSTGYVVLLPDYIGFGVSENVFHPYIEARHSADAVIDMIKATKEFLTQSEIPFSDKLFLTGYSEGGYVTGVALREIEREGNMNITATTIGAPAIDLVETIKQIADARTYSTPSFLPYIYLAYRSVYDMTEPITDFFNAKYKDIARFYDGSKDSNEINRELTTNISELCNPNFLQAIKTKDIRNTGIRLLKENSWHNFKPKTPVRIYHGTNDVTLPFAITENYANTVKNSGNTNVTLVKLNGKDHFSAFMPMAIQSFLWLETFR